MNKSFWIFTFLIFAISTSSIGQTCSPDSLITRSVKANTTDANINWEFQNHQVFFNPDCTPNGKLLLHLVGTFDNPESTTYFPSLAANNGYKAVCLKYLNSISGTSACRNSTDPDCHKKYHQEVVFGTASSTAVNVDSNQSISNRITKLILYLDDQFPTEGWDEFLTDSDEIDWSKVALSGHSQGGGHSAYIAKTYSVDRAIFFASPNDYSAQFGAPADWLNDASATPDSSLYGFGNTKDEVVDFGEQLQQWNTFGMNTYGDSLYVKGKACPFSYSRIIYTRDTAASGLAANHNAVIMDDFTPISMGNPEFTAVWKYMLGLCPVAGSSRALKSQKQMLVYPNPFIDQLTFVTENTLDKTALIKIYNATGVLVEQNDARISEGRIVINDLESLQNGIYIVHYDIGSKSYRIKASKL